MQSPTPTNWTYQEISRGKRAAQTLYEAEYDDAYVWQALTEKGFTHQQAVWLMRAAELENVEHRMKKGRLIAIILGIGWAVIVTLFFLWGNPTTVDGQGRQYVLNPIYVLGGFVIFILTLVNYFRSRKQYLRVKAKLPPDPSDIGEHERA